MDLIKQIQSELKNKIDTSYNYQLYFKEPIKAYGVRYPIVRKLAKKFLPKNKTKEEVIQISKQLFSSEKQEDFIIAVEFLKHSKLTKQNFLFLESILIKYANNWAKIDDFCPTLINPLIQSNPELIPKIKSWNKSKNMWLRRASCVSFLHDAGGSKPSKHELKDIFEVALPLLKDKEDLVQKGAGWLLKNSSKNYPKEVLKFIKDNYSKFSRTSLRYAIELYPKEVRKEILAFKN